MTILNLFSLHEVNPELLSGARIVAAYSIFFGSYFVFALGKFPGLKIDRPGAAIIGAVLMVAFRIVGPHEAVGFLDFGTIVLLFSMMLMVANLHLVGFFDWLTEWIVERLKPHHLLPIVIFTSGLLSAVLVNDIICLVMTPFVLRITRRVGLAPLPYLLAVATASNIGSVATITGNPQNMLIGSVSHIRYLDFVAHLAPVAVAGLCLDWALIHWLYMRGGLDCVEVRKAMPAPQLKSLRKKPIVVLLLVLAGFFAGVPPAMMAALGAALMLITRTVEPRKVYDEIDWGLLVFFSGLFVIVGGAERAGLTETLLCPMTAWNLHRLPSFVCVTAILSNLVSNVPAVMLLKSFVPGFPNAHTGWLALAMASTLAGNLTITGSVANIIVVEGARAEGVPISFRDYLRLGLPVTIASLAIGLAWLWLAC
jgi:Na+/H+ antiporter NhaD/arsenite permease-like protein